MHIDALVYIVTLNFPESIFLIELIPYSGWQIRFPVQLTFLLYKQPNQWSIYLRHLL